LIRGECAASFTELFKVKAGKLDRAQVRDVERAALTFASLFIIVTTLVAVL
jgi:hypothetical protein